MEVMRYRDVAEYLAEAEGESNTQPRDHRGAHDQSAQAESALVRETLDGCLSVGCFTVLRPLNALMQPFTRWNRPSARESLVPSGFRARDLQVVRPAEKTELFLERVRQAGQARAGLYDSRGQHENREQDAMQAMKKGHLMKSSFGKSLGRGLTIKTPSVLQTFEEEKLRALLDKSGSSERCSPTGPGCLQIRQFLQYQPVNNATRIKYV